jgi:flagellar biosynthesis anti-sigma factor FlgM
MAQTLASASQMRDAKIRELQEAVKSGSYHVPAEQLADKMLRDTLHEVLP